MAMRTVPPVEGRFCGGATQPFVQFIANPFGIGAGHLAFAIPDGLAQQDFAVGVF